MNQGIAIFGGTFDPIHIGHLQSALEVQQALGLNTVRLVPSFVPPHREGTGCTAEQRLAMVRLAVQGCPALEVDTREILRGGPSFSIDTLGSIRSEIGDRALIMVMGMDSFATLPSWHRYEELLDLAHLLVLDRPGCIWAPDEELARIIQGRVTADLTCLVNSSCGLVGRMRTTQLNVSATQIRSLVREGKLTGFLLPDAVLGYIEEMGIYRQ